MGFAPGSVLDLTAKKKTAPIARIGAVSETKTNNLTIILIPIKPNLSNRTGHMRLFQFSRWGEKTMGL